MKPVRFHNPSNIQFANAVRRNVNEYFRQKNLNPKGGWWMAFKIPFILGIYLAPIALVILLPLPWWAALLMWAVSGFGLAATGMSVMHDAVHGALSGKKWVNELVSMSMYVLGGSPFTWKVQHNLLHHTFTNVHGYDEDFESLPVLRLNWAAKLKKLHRWQHIYAPLLYCLMTFAMIISDFSQLVRYNKRGLVAQVKGNAKAELVKIIITKVLYAGYIFALPMIFSSQPWWLILIGFAVMHMVAGLFMATIFQLAHVIEGVDQVTPDPETGVQSEWAAHQLATTANFARNNRILGFFIGGLNFQIEHHLFPHISHVHYRRIAPIVEKTAKEHGLQYIQKKSFFHALISHIRMLRLLGTRPQMG
jgi:linoleoyl-CoA desaturase